MEKCDSCIKKKSEYCPNSFECYSTKGKPHYDNGLKALAKLQQIREYCEPIKSNGQFDCVTMNVVDNIVSILEEE